MLEVPFCRRNIRFFSIDSFATLEFFKKPIAVSAYKIQLKINNSYKYVSFTKSDRIAVFSAILKVLSRITMKKKHMNIYFLINPNHRLHLHRYHLLYHTYNVLSIHRLLFVC